MDVQRTGVSKLQRVWRWSLPLGAATPIFSLMFGLLFHTVFYEIARSIPSVFRQDAHISIPLCKIMPKLFGCDPGVGALTGLQIWELSQEVGQISGLLINLILVAIFSAWVTLRVCSDSALPGILTGIAGGFSSLVLALAFNVPLNIRSLQGIFGILTLSLLPLSGLAGGLIGKDRLARRPSRRSVRFLPGDDTVGLGWVGESLSKRELEVLALVAEGFKNREIAQQLSVSSATVKTHLIHIFAKLGVDNRTAAVTQALACGLLRQEE
jgi:DNA-binding CsgD family transcriptional regulator